jgi:hypothetical protein
VEDCRSFLVKNFNGRSTTSRRRGESLQLHLRPRLRPGFEPTRFGLTHEEIGFADGGVMLLLGDCTFEFGLT